MASLSDEVTYEDVAALRNTDSMNTGTVSTFSWRFSDVSDMSYLLNLDAIIVILS